MTTTTYLCKYSPVVLGSFSFKAEKSDVSRHFEKRGSISKNHLTQTTSSPLKEEGGGWGGGDVGAQG